MGHYAKTVASPITIVTNKVASTYDGYIVSRVIVADSSFFNTFVDTSPGQWIQCSYNSRGNVHYAPSPPAVPYTPDGEPAFRANYPGPGYIYDPTVTINGVEGVFYEQQPFPSWTLNNSTFLWEPPNPPGPAPVDGKFYIWDEATTSWVPLSSLS